MSKDLKVYDIFTYIEDEVVRQGYDTHTVEGFKRIHYMMEAWGYAINRYEQYGRLTHELIRILGGIIEPTKNTVYSYRTCEVTVGNNPTPRSIDVFKLMDDLINKYNNMMKDGYLNKLDAGPFYKEFEEIHPFADGNGRVGKILFNYVQKDALYDPIMPPNFWGISNP